MAVISRLVTTDVALSISFVTKEPGPGNVSSSIGVHMWTFLTNLILDLSGCVFLYTGVCQKKNSDIASAFDHFRFSPIGSRCRRKMVIAPSRS